jgi:hypothetical protein
MNNYYFQNIVHKFVLINGKCCVFCDVQPKFVNIILRNWGLKLLAKISEVDVEGTRCTKLREGSFLEKAINFITSNVFCVEYCMLCGGH